MNGERQPLRVGLILDRRGIARYALDILRQIRAMPLVTIDVIVRDARHRRFGGWIFRAYTALDRRITGVTDDPIEIIDGTSELTGLPEIPLAELTARRVDLIIDLRQQAAPDSTDIRPSLGWWWLHGGTRGPAGFWEIVSSNPLTKVELHAGQAAGVVALGRAATATKTGLSWVRNRQALYRVAVTLVVEKLRQVRERGLARTAVTGSFSKRVATPGQWPTSVDVILWLIPAVAAKIARRLTRRKAVTVWQMAIRKSDRALVEGAVADLEGFTWLRAPGGRQHADPFLVLHGDRTWCFFEDIDETTGRGRIAASEVSSGKLEPPVTVLERPYHLSYPCLFRDGDVLFMIPESSENGTIELYRCVTFPGEWTLERVLMRQTAVDSTIWVQEGRYWLFATHLDERSHATELWLYFSDSLSGAWQSHPENPISLDVRNARGAGAIIRHGGRLFRPSQDCSIRYGRSFSLNEIVSLTPDRYEERPVVTVEPMPGFVCTHTYARSGSIEMIDGCVLADPRTVT